MPFDGIVVKSITEELSKNIVGGRVDKIFQPETDEIILNVRAKGQNLKLVLSANANYPRIHITEISKENPSVPPVFCMLLRKHLSGGKITDIRFHDYERIVTVEIEAIDELGDISVKKLVIEIMGRHSNIILLNKDSKIIDSIKHVDNEVSSVREVMPARPYVLPPAQNKISPDEIDTEVLFAKSLSADSTVDISVEKYLLNNIKGFSPLLCREICHRADIDGKTSISKLNENELARISNILNGIITNVTQSLFSPCIFYQDKAMDNPVDFHCIEINQYTNIKYLPSISRVLDVFYSTKDSAERLKQKKSDLFKVLNNNLDRCNKKLALHHDKLREVADRDKLKLFGELITANIYCIPQNEKSVSLLNYYSENGEYIDIPLNENITPQENAQRYYKQYSKAKSAYAYASSMLEETKKELEYFESVLHTLENSSSIQEIEEIRQELIEQGYLAKKKKTGFKKQEKALDPLHFKSSDGLDIYVGRNNRQNDLLTLKMASSNDIWLHTRNIPGSHVIIRKYQHDIPDSTLLEAAVLAAYHSKAKFSSNVPVDYTTVKNVKKPNGAKPGMVIYENFKTIISTPDESTINKLKVEK